MSLKKLDIKEKAIVDTVGTKEFDFRVCLEHGFYAVKKNTHPSNCLYCKEIGELVENIEELM